MALQEKTTKWLRRGSAALVDQVLFAASGFLANILLARWLGLEQYGAFALGFSIYLFLSGFHNAMLLEPMSVLGPASYRNTLPQYLGKLITLHFGLTIVLGLLVGIAGSVFGYFSKGSSLPAALWGVAVATPCMLFFWLWRRAAYLDLRPNVALRGAAVNTVLVVVLLFGVRAMGWLNPFTAFGVQAIAGLAASVVLMVSVRPQLSLKPRLWWDATMRKVLAQHWEYGRWVVVTAFVFWLAGDAYYVIVASAGSMNDAAVLRAVQNFVKPVQQFVIAITLLLVPWASARFADGKMKAFRGGVNRITIIFTTAAAVYLLALTVCGKWLTQVVYGGKYTEFAYLLPLMTLPVLFTAAAEGPAIAVRAMQVPSEVFWAYGAAAIPTVLFGVLLVRRWGVIGAAAGLALSSLVYCIALTYRYKMRIAENPPLVEHADAELASESASTV
jgi:O-antigen/teichoic acid export membrane protein